MKKILIFIVLVVIVGLVFYLIDKQNQTKLSFAQQKAEQQLGEGVIAINDLQAKFSKEVDFQNKKASLIYGDKENRVDYTIFDILQPFNIDEQGDQEWPFLMRAEYSDGKKTVYLIIAREQADKFVSVDQVEVGNPEQIDEIHSLNDREVTIDAHIGQGDDEEKVILSYTLENDKIITGKDNIDLNTKPKAKEEPKPQPAKKDSDQPKDSGGGKGTIALSFDDGPGKSTPDILDILKSHDIKATFFMIGENAAKRTDYVKRVHEEGHEIGDHTYDHANLQKLSYDAQYDEINHALQIIKGAVPDADIHYMRPPYGNYNDDTIKVLDKLGMEKMLWNVDTRDWSGKSAEAIKEAALSGAKDGAIILMHDGVANSVETAKALPGIIQELKNRGYKMVTISELKGR